MKQLSKEQLSEMLMQGRKAIQLGALGQAELLYLSILKSLSLILYLLISGKYISKKFGLLELSNEFRFFHVIFSLSLLAQKRR